MRNRNVEEPAKSKNFSVLKKAATDHRAHWMAKSIAAVVNRGLWGAAERTFPISVALQSNVNDYQTLRDKLIWAVCEPSMLTYFKKDVRKCISKTFPTFVGPSVISR